MNNIVPRHENGNGQDAINGRGILRRKLSPNQRAALGADIALGTVHLAPSLKQAAAAAGTSVYQLCKELADRGRVEVERRAIEQRLNLQVEAERVNAEASAIAAAWEAASPSAREAAVRIIGVTAVWNTLASVVA
jgi:hypothetical protein